MTLQSLMSKAPFDGLMRVRVLSKDGEESKVFDFETNADKTLKNHPGLKPYGDWDVSLVFATAEPSNGVYCYDYVGRLTIEVMESEAAK